MRKLAFLYLVMTSTAIHAEVFKCLGNFGKAVYQSHPCTDTTKGQQLAIETKPDPDQDAAAKAKLATARAEYQAKKAAADQLPAEQNKEAAAATGLAGKNPMARQGEERRREKEEFEQ